MDSYEVTKRYWQVEVRAVGAGKQKRLTGVIKYNEVSKYKTPTRREVLRPGCFTKSIRENDIYFLKSHDSDEAYGSTQSGTLVLNDTSTGLNFELKIPNTQAGRDLWTNVNLGNMKEMSFGFLPLNRQQEQISGETVDVLYEGDLMELSAVVWGAYGLSTSVAARANNLKISARKKEKRMTSLQRAKEYLEDINYKNYTQIFNAVKRQAEYNERDPKLSERASGLSLTDGPEISADLVTSLLQPQNISPLWTLAKKIPIGGGFSSVHLPSWHESTRSGSVLGGVSFQWLEESGATSGYVKPKFRQLNMNLHKCMGIVAYTDELLEDGAAFESVIYNAMQSGLNSLIEEMIIRGTGAGQPLGIMNAGATIVQGKEIGQNADTINALNITGMMSHLPPESMYKAIWMTHTETLQELSQLSTTAGTASTPLFRYRQGGQKYHQLCGLDVMFSDHCSKLGDKSDLLLFDPSEIIVTFKEVKKQISIHVNFSTAEEVFKITFRWNAQPAWSNPSTPSQGDTMISPFVVLAERA